MRFHRCSFAPFQGQTFSQVRRMIQFELSLDPYSAPKKPNFIRTYAFLHPYFILFVFFTFAFHPPPRTFWHFVRFKVNIMPMPNRKNFLSDKGKEKKFLGAQEVCKAKGKIDMCVSFRRAFSSCFRSDSLLLFALKFSTAKLPAKGIPASNSTENKQAPVGEQHPS